MEHRGLPGSPGRTGAASPVAGARGGGAHPTALKRKLTLLALIDELSALKEDDTSLQGYGNEEKRGKDAFAQTEVYEDPSFKEGAAAFERFDKSFNTLIQGLFAFQTAARQLDSSVGLLASTSELCERLHNLELIFHENAAVLFPQIKSKVLDIEPPKTKRRRPENRGRSNGLFVRPAAITVSPDPETLPEELLGLAKGIKAFLVHLEEFPEFVDEALNASITAFERDLTYRADCLEEYEDQFRWPSVQRYVHTISTEMTEHVQMITRALKDFVDNGVPAIHVAQQSSAENLLFLSTIATFFSVVTATAAQYSYATTSRTIDNIVNLLFFGSLIFSISAAINSLLGLTWKRAMYRSPRHKVPWWVLIWTERSPLVFMVVSVGLFSAGLVCFCYATQTIFVAMTILILTTFCTFGLVAVSAWFLAERYIYSKHNGLRWLSDVLHDHWTRFIKHPQIQFIRYIPRRIRDGLRRLKHNLCCGDEEFSELEDGLPFPNGMDVREKATPSPVGYRHPRISGSMDKGVGITESPLNPIDRPETPVSPTPMMQSPSRHFSFATASVAAYAAAASNSPTTATEGILVNGPKLKGANLFRQLAWKVAAENTRNGTTATSPTRGMSVARSMTVLSDPGRRRDTDEGSHHMKAGRISALRPSLKKLRVTNTIWDHTAPVRHLQFSPNGKVLATCGWDGTTRLFDVPTTAGEPIGQRNVMAVAGKSLGTVTFWGQAAWSPDGRWLLTKWMAGIQVWTESGVRKATIARGKMVRSVAWLPSSEAFLSVEGSQVVKMSVDGIVQETHELERLDLQDVAVTPDEERMLGVANLLSTKSGFHPSLSRAEKRIVVYNLKDKMIENLVPVLDDVRDITISRNGQFALVSSEGKGPPQLFRMDKIKVKDNRHDDDDDEIDEVVRLVPVRTYLPKTEVDFAGASCFGGQEDEFILVPTKSGDILFWDQDSGRLLHALRNKDVGDGDLTSVAWNYASKRHILASACRDGSVRIWTSSAPERDGTRGKERDNASVASHPYGSDHDMELSVSSTNMSRRPTNTDGASHTHGEPSTYVTGRASMEESTEGAGPSFVDPTDKREGRRVESPVPAELPGDKTTATEGILVNGPELKGANLFRQLAWKVAAENTQNETTATSPIHGMSVARSIVSLSDPGRQRDTDEVSHHLKAGRISAPRPSLKKLRVTDTIWDHTALVRHLQFSPNGKVLATCGWDGTIRLFDVPTTAGEPVGQRNVMAVAGKSLGAVMFWGQAAWSPDGLWLLTKWMTGIQVWTESGVRKATIARGKLVRSVAWLPSSETFLSVEGSQVVEMSVDGTIRETHELDRLDLQGVAVTPDEERMLGVANLLSTKSGLQPGLARAEKRIVVYNLKYKRIENLVPVLDDVRDITISRNGQFALVSSEGKGPPQLFRMDKIKVKDNRHDDDDDEIDEVVRLVPVRTYLPKAEVDFAGASYFAGQEDEFILVPTKSGDILFWDQDSGRLLHALRNKDVGDGDLTSVAWNYASKRYMLASACHDGSVRIWTSSAPERDGTPFLMEEEKLALAHHTKGRYDEAEKLQRKVVWDRQQVLGTNHPDTIMAMENLVVILTEQFRWTEAERLQLEVLEKQRNSLGSEHPNAIEAAAVLAAILSEQEDWSVAEQLQRNALEQKSRIFGKDHLDTIRAAANLASTYHVQGTWSTAANLRLGILEQRNRILGEDHPDTVLAAESLEATHSASKEVTATDHFMQSLRNSNEARAVDSFAAVDLDSDSVSSSSAKLIPEADFGVSFVAERNSGQSKSKNLDVHQDGLPILNYESAPSIPTWLVDAQQNVIEQVRLWYHGMGPLAKAREENPPLSNTGHSYRVQLVALNFELSETSMMVDRNSTFSHIGFHLKTHGVAPLPVALEQINGPLPRWRIPDIDSRVPPGVQKIYVVDLSEPVTMALVRDLEEDFPLLLSLSSFNDTTTTLGDLIGARLDGRAKSWASIRFLSSPHDIQGLPCEMVQKEIKEVYSTTIFVLLTDDPLAYKFRNVYDGQVPPPLQVAFPQCRNLVESAPRLKAFAFQAIDFSRALLHLAICLAGAAIEEKIEGALQAYLISRLKSMVIKLRGIFTDIENSTDNLPPSITKSLHLFFYQLCEDQPGVITVRQSLESLQALIALDPQGQGSSLRIAEMSPLVREEDSVEQDGTLLHVVTPREPSGLDGFASSDSLSSSDHESSSILAGDGLTQ